MNESDLVAVLARMKKYQNFTELLKVDDIDSDKLVTFRPNNVQRRLMNRITLAKREGKPSRLVILKARQMGMSTLLQSVIFHRAMTRRGYKARTIANERKNGEDIFAMTEQFYRNLPAAITDLEPFQRRAHKSGNRLNLNNDSSMIVETANNKTSGRGAHPNALHLSEVAFWTTDAERTSQSLMQGVQDRPGSLIALESTPNGMGGYFYDQYMRAKSGDSDFEAVFEPWFVFETYRRKTEGYLQYDGQGNVIFLDEEEEIEYHTPRPELDGETISDDQLAWRRYTIANKLKGDEERFREEYPSDDETCFLTSGRLYFTSKYVSGWTPPEPLLVGDIAGKKIVEETHGPLRVYALPEKGRKYVASIDPAGIQGDHHVGTESEEDFSVIWVVRCHDLKTVAVYRDKVDPDVLARRAVDLAKLYNKALLAPEVNGEGMVVLFKLKDVLRYRNIYRRVRNESRYEPETELQGWKTQMDNRPAILRGLFLMLRDAPLKLSDARLKTEMLTFVILNGKAQAKVGTHDDCVLAAAIAYQVASENPHILRTDENDRPIKPTPQQYAGRPYERPETRDGLSPEHRRKYPA